MNISDHSARRKIISAFAFLVVFLVSLNQRYDYAFSPRMWPDEAKYAWYARSIIDSPSRIFSPEIIEFAPPLYALTLCPAHLFFPPWTACQLMSLLWAMLGIAAVYWAGRRLTGDEFAGLAAAVFMAVNTTYLPYSSRILADIPFMIVLSVLAVSLAGRAGCELRRGWIVGVLGSLAILLKWGGVLVVPWIVCRYLWGGQGWRKDLPLLARPLGVVGLTILVLLGMNGLVLGQLLPQSSALFKAYVPQTALFYIVELPHLVGGWWVLFLAGAGVYYLRAQRAALNVLAAWVVIFVMGLSFAAERLDRYALAFLPALWILAGAGAAGAIADVGQRIGRTQVLRLIMVAGLLFLFFARIPELDRILSINGKFYLGYDLAGREVRRFLERNPGGVVIASDPYNIRYHAGILLADARKVFALPLRNSDFERLLSSLPGPVIVEVDNWGDPAILRIDPLEDGGVEYFDRMGFRLAGTFSRLRYQRPDGKEDVAPAVWLFARE